MPELSRPAEAAKGRLTAQWAGLAALGLAMFGLLPAPGPAEARSPPERCARPSTLARMPAPDPQLRVRFMGTSTLLFEDGATQILIDGYFSRPPLAQAAAGWVSPDCDRIAGALQRAGVDARLKTIFVAHAHVDHVLDAPEIALMTGARLMGSGEVGLVARGHDLPEDQFERVTDRAAVGEGAFRVTPILTPHSRPNTARGRITRPVPRFAWAQRYRARTSHAFLIEHGERRILVYPSTASGPDLLKGVRADTVFLGISGLGRRSKSSAEAYWAEVVTAVGAKRVYPIHWDNFGLSLDEPLQPMPLPFDYVARGQKLIAKLACRHGVELLELTAFEPVPLEPPAPPAPRRDCRPAGST